jgi:hypothetical protein
VDEIRRRGGRDDKPLRMVSRSTLHRLPRGGVPAGANSVCVCVGVCVCVRVWRCVCVCE